MRLQRALSEYFVAGIKTNISLFQRILQDPDFREGKFDTGYSTVCWPRKENALERRAGAGIAAIAAGCSRRSSAGGPRRKNGACEKLLRSLQLEATGPHEALR